MSPHIAGVPGRCQSATWSWSLQQDKDGEGTHVLQRSGLVLGGEGQGSSCRHLCPLWSQVRPGWVPRRVPVQASRPPRPGGQGWLCSGPRWGRVSILPEVNYLCLVTSKLFQFYIFKYLIIRHQIFMQFY